MAASATVGLLVLAAWAVAPAAGQVDRQPRGTTPSDGARRDGQRAVWAGAALVVIVLTAAHVSGDLPATSGFSLVFFSFTSQLELGRALLVSLLLVLLTVVVSALATRVVAVAFAAVNLPARPAAARTVGARLRGGRHMNAVDSLALHLVGWRLGRRAGALVLIGGRLGAERTRSRRFSTLAGVASSSSPSPGGQRVAARRKLRRRSRPRTGCW